MERAYPLGSIFIGEHATAPIIMMTIRCRENIYTTEHTNGTKFFHFAAHSHTDRSTTMLLSAYIYSVGQNNITTGPISKEMAKFNNMVLGF